MSKQEVLEKINAYIYDNVSGEISASRLKRVLKAIVDFVGDADTVPAVGTPDRIYGTDANGGQTTFGKTEVGSVFIATYGSTTYGELEAAYNSGLVVAVKFNGLWYYLHGRSNTDGRFEFYGKPYVTGITIGTSYVRNFNIPSVLLNTSNRWSDGMTISDIVAENSLTSNSPSYLLSANQGKLLNESKADKATTLAGYNIADAHIKNGVITLGANSITPVTQESDPVFAASPAHGITNAMITQWNAAEANVQPDWSQSDSSADDFIKNKPNLSVYALVTDLVNVERTVAATLNSLNRRVSALEAVLTTPPVITGLPSSAIQIDSDNPSVTLTVNASNLQSDIQVISSNPELVLSANTISQTAMFPYSLTVSCASASNQTGTITLKALGCTVSCAVEYEYRVTWKLLGSSSSDNPANWSKLAENTAQTFTVSLAQGNNYMAISSSDSMDGYISTQGKSFSFSTDDAWNFETKEWGGYYYVRANVKQAGSYTISYDGSTYTLTT